MDLLNLYNYLLIQKTVTYPDVKKYLHLGEIFNILENLKFFKFFVRIKHTTLNCKMIFNDSVDCITLKEPYKIYDILVQFLKNGRKPEIT